MTLTAFLSLSFNGSQVVGSVRAKEREGQIVVIGMRHEVGTVRQQSGHPAPGAKHRVLIVQKDIDRASPILHQAFGTNVAFSNFQLDLQRMPPAGGPRETFCSITLVQPQIAWIRATMPFLRRPEFEPLPEYEEVAFSYAGITWAYSGAGDGSSSGNTSYTDDKPDFSADEPHWSTQLERILREKLKGGADAAGVAAKDALKELLAQKLGGTQGEDK